MSSLNWDDYEDVLDELDKDMGPGDHDVEVMNVNTDPWKSGDWKVAVKFGLMDINNAIAFCTFSELTPPKELKEQLPTMSDRQRKGVKLSLNIRKQLEEHYGIKDPHDIKEGMKFRVKLYRETKPDDLVMGRRGLLKVNAFLPKSGSTSTPAF